MSPLALLFCHNARRLCVIAGRYPALPDISRVDWSLLKLEVSTTAVAAFTYFSDSLTQAALENLLFDCSDAVLLY